MPKRANHSVKKLTSPDLPNKENLRNSNATNDEFKESSLKPIPKELIKNMLNDFFKKVPIEKLNKQSTVFKSANINTAIITCENPKDTEETLSKINLEIIGFMNNWIESETGESCKKYYRNYSLYESKSDENRLILTWF